ncbi:IclR family transcriptional regulator [Haloarchaeobius salinus]|uniref:IclR family transcriptional regulator n=1 Tax=Haloarchaeobius salinus TaxID=1198298 RepID=UPI00210D02EE|nr:IclR family transcriptional regulator [Haloarchaeobius salinus]
MDDKANHPVKTTQKSLVILEELLGRDGARISELASELDMTKGSIHNHVSTLREKRYVVKDEDTDIYRVGLKFLTMGGKVRGQYDIYKFGRPKIDRVANETGHLANLMVEENGLGVYLYQSRGDHAVNLDTYTGHRIRMHNIAIGKAILAHLPQDRVEAILDRWGMPKDTDRTITTPARLFGELETFREQGYATEYQERTERLACIGAPVTIDETLHGALSVSVPAKNVDSTQFDDDLIDTVLQTANQLSLDIKYA